MDRKVLHIQRPEVIEENGKSILRATVIDAGETKSVEYKVDSKFGKYLTVERSDAFVMTLLYYAMIKDRDIEWEAPCNERLIYQLETFFIPVYAQEMRFMHKIKLTGPTTTKLLPCENAVGTGISNGVDSCYTLRKYTEAIQYPDQRLTHAVFADFFLDFQSDEYKADFVDKYMQVLPECVKELGLELIYVSMNVDRQFSIGHFKDDVCGIIQDVGLGTLKFCSVPLALQKLFKVYYFSSTYATADFSMHKPDLTYHDIFTLPIITTEAVRFYSSGVEEPRVNKAASIADWPYAQRHLQVCALGSEDNCGRCVKCLRTMDELYAAGKLEFFRDVFPVDDYMEHLPQRLSLTMAGAKLGNVFDRDIVAKFRENGTRIPTMAHVLLPFYTVREYARTHLRTVKWVRKIYRSLNIDKVIYGRRTDTSTWVDKE